MKSTLDKSTRSELIARINLLNESSINQWGKMSIYQMLKHCTLWDEWVLGKNKPEYKQAFIGRLFGKKALNDLIKDESPLKRNMPTLSALKVKEHSGNVLSEKEKWVKLMEDYEHFSNPGFIHSFFGKMTKEQIGYMAYKHADHHLRQFGV